MGCVAEWAENAGIVKSLIELPGRTMRRARVCRPLDRERLLAVPNAVTLIRDQETADIILGSAIGSRDASRRITLPI